MELLLRDKALLSVILLILSLLLLFYVCFRLRTGSRQDGLLSRRGHLPHLVTLVNVVLLLI